jgi:hypothetical protein
MPSTSSTTSLHDQPLKHSRPKRHPRVFVTLCGVTIFISACLYTLLVLYPSYQSSIYRSEDAADVTFLVPFYTYDPSALIDTSHLIWTLVLCVITFTLFFIPPLSLALLIVLVRKWPLFTLREQIFWSSSVVIVWVGYILTFSAGMNFAAWLVD